MMWQRKKQVKVVSGNHEYNNVEDIVAFLGFFLVFSICCPAVEMDFCRETTFEN